MGSRGTEVVDIALPHSICMYIEFNNLIYALHLVKKICSGQYTIYMSRYMLHSYINILYMVYNGYDQKKEPLSEVILKTVSQNTKERASLSWVQNGEDSIGFW